MSYMLSSRPPNPGCRVHLAVVRETKTLLHLLWETVVRLFVCVWVCFVVLFGVRLLKGERLYKNSDGFQILTL